MPTITTVEQLRAYMNEIDPQKHPISDDEIIWYACMQLAHNISEDFSTKDLAHLFRGGITPLNTVAQVQNVIDSFYCYIDKPDLTEIEILQTKLDEISLKLSAANFVGNQLEADNLVEQLNLVNSEMDEWLNNNMVSLIEPTE